MTRQKTIAALLLSLLLTGCGKADVNRWQDWQEEVIAAKELRFSMEITSHTEEDAVTFAAEVTAEEETVTMTVTAPETIRGVSVVSKGKEDSLSYADTVLSLTAGRRAALSPSGAAALLLGAVREGHILYTSQSGDVPSAVFSGPEDTTLTLWLGEDGTPTAAELDTNGRTALTMTVSGWQMGEG